MRFSNPATIGGHVFNRLKVDDAGASTRALLGAGADSVIAADVLVMGTARLPARPLVAYRPGPVVTVGGLDQHGASWWIYDEPARGTAGLDLVAAQLVTAYDTDRGAPPLPSPCGAVRVGTLSEPRIDSALGLIARRFDLITEG